MGRKMTQKLREQIAAKPREDAEQVLSLLMGHQIEIDRITTAMDAEIKTIRDLNAVRLGELGESVDDLMAWLEVWADSHKEAFPKDRKSLDMAHGTIGFRTGTPKAATLRGWTWAKVLDTMIALKEWRPFVRSVEEVDKEALIASREVLSKDRFAAIGVEIKQDETFFAELKRETAEAQS